MTSKWAKGAEALQQGAKDGGNCIPVIMAHGQANAEVVSDGSPSLTCNHEAPIMVRMREGKAGGGKGPLVSEDQSLTLATGNDQVLCSPTLTASNDPSRSPQSSEVTAQVEAVHRASMQVRRLTPVECSRLQGFPDTYLDITFRGKPAADGNKYKALGNSWAVPVVRWIGEQIKRVSNQ